MREDLRPVEYHDKERSYSTEVFALWDEPGAQLVPARIGVGESVSKWEGVNVLEYSLVNLKDVVDFFRLLLFGLESAPFGYLLQSSYTCKRYVKVVGIS